MLATSLFLCICCLSLSVFNGFRTGICIDFRSTRSASARYPYRSISSVAVSAKRRSSRLSRKRDDSKNYAQDESIDADEEHLLSQQEVGSKINTATASSIESELRADIDQLQRKSLYDPLMKSSSPDSAAISSSNPFGKLNDVLSIIFIADFFLILVFLAWFLAAVGLQSAYPEFLASFQSIFQPVVVPALTVLMVGSIASGISGQFNKPKDSL